MKRISKVTLRMVLLILGVFAVGFWSGYNKSQQTKLTAAISRSNMLSIEQIQILLAQLGLYQGDIDGIAGAKTITAWSEYSRIYDNRMIKLFAEGNNAK